MALYIYRGKNVEKLLSQALRKYLAKNSDSDSTDESEAEDKDDLLVFLRNSIFIIAIYLYFIGWLFLYYFYWHFGISISSLDIPIYFFIVYSYSVIASSYWWWFLLSIICLLLIIFASKSNRRLRKFLIILFLLIFFPVSNYTSKETAFEAALRLRKGFGLTIEIVFKETQKETQKSVSENSKDIEKESSSKNYPEKIIRANSERNLRLITQTKDKFFVLYQPKAEIEGGELPICYTYVIAATEVSLFTIRGQNIKDAEIEFQDIPR